MGTASPRLAAEEPHTKLELVLADDMATLVRERRARHALKKLNGQE